MEHLSLLSGLEISEAAIVHAPVDSSNCYDCDSGDSCDDGDGCDCHGCDS